MSSSKFEVGHCRRGCRLRRRLRAGGRPLAAGSGRISIMISTRPRCVPESKTALDEDGHTSQRKSGTSRYGWGRIRTGVGTEEYNIGLFRRRAKSVVDYLVDAGIAPDRLSWKAIANPCRKDYQTHQQRVPAVCGRDCADSGIY